MGSGQSLYHIHSTIVCTNNIFQILMPDFAAFIELRALAAHSFLYRRLCSSVLMCWNFCVFLLVLICHFFSLFSLFLCVFACFLNDIFLKTIHDIDQPIRLPSTKAGRMRQTQHTSDIDALCANAN